MPWHPCTFARVAAADWHLRLTPSSLGAAWTKWVDDLLFTQSMLQSLPDGPAGNMPGVAPCVFGNCRNNPRPASGGGPGAGHKLQAVLETDVAWGSVLPLLGVYTARLTDDARLASRSAVGAAAYVGLLHSFANSPTSDFPGLLNATSSGSVGWAGRLGDWCPAVQAPGQRQVSTLLNSHHLILDTDAAVSLLEWHDEDSLSASGPGDRPRDAYADAGPSASELAQWAATARSSFAKAFLHNITFPVTGPVVCGSAPEKIPLELTCGGGQTIERVGFAGYGLPNGTCTAGFRPNTECYLDVSPQVAAACLGKPTCSIECDPVYPQKRVCAGTNVPDPCAGIAKTLSVSVECSMASPELPPSTGPISGLAFRDLYPPASCQPQAQTEAASGMAAMDLAPDWVVDEGQRAALAEMLAALAANRNASSSQKVTVTGGIIDMNHLAPELIRHGRPDVAFDLLAADGRPSYFNMARYGGTLWENWDNANGCDTPAGCEAPRGAVQASGTGVGSLNHIMYSGSVGEAVFGIGGIQPFKSPAGDRPSVAPILWLPEAPRGSAVWRSRDGVISAAWSAAQEGLTPGPTWHAWVNVTVPAASDGADIQVLLPRSTAPTAFCAWECGLATATYNARWVSFDAGGGHMVYRAGVPHPTHVMTPARLATCALLWSKGAASMSGAPGVERVGWAAARPGRTMFPALTLVATSGAYAIYAQAC